MSLLSAAVQHSATNSSKISQALADVAPALRQCMATAASSKKRLSSCLVRCRSRFSEALWKAEPEANVEFVSHALSPKSESAQVQNELYEQRDSFAVGLLSDVRAACLSAAPTTAAVSGESVVACQLPSIKLLPKFVREPLDTDQSTTRPPCAVVEQAQVDEHSGKPARTSRASVERRYTCGLCNKVFRRAFNLKSHLLVHTGERLFDCSKCDRRFTFEKNLIDHVRAVHDGIVVRSREKRRAAAAALYGSDGASSCKRKPSSSQPLGVQHVPGCFGTYECGVCRQRLDRKCLLDEHLRDDHGGLAEPYSCDTCGQQFVYWCLWKRHARTHRNS